MVDVKTCLDNAQEKMDMAIMYLEEALASRSSSPNHSWRQMY